MWILKTSRPLTALAAALLLAGCSTLPFDPPPQATRAPSVALPAAFAQAGSLPQAPLERGPWWQALGDATLSALIEQGVAANLDLQQAAERVQQARALAAGSRAAALPSGAVSAGAQSRTLARAEAPALPRELRRTDTAGVSLGLDWEVDLFGRLRNRATAAQHRVTASEADADALALLVGAEIARAWYERVGALEQASLTRAVIENRRATVGLVQRRAAAGYATPIDEARVRADLAAAEADLPVFEATAVAAAHRLAVLLGQLPSTFVPPHAPPQRPVQVELVVPEPSRWLAGRPDLHAAERHLAAQAHDVAAIRADFMPRLSVSGVLGFVAGSVTGIGAVSGISWLASPTLSLPVFDRTRIQARLDAATAQQRELLLAYHQGVLQAVEEVETALAWVGQGQMRLAALYQRAQHATAAHSLARTRYQAGASDLLELLDAQRSAHQADLGLAAAMTAHRQRVVVLLRALGPGGWATSTTHALASMHAVQRHQSNVCVTNSGSRAASSGRPC